jgi:hypothetical protein
MPDTIGTPDPTTAPTTTPGGIALPKISFESMFGGFDIVKAFVNRVTSEFATLSDFIKNQDKSKTFAQNLQNSSEDVKKAFGDMAAAASFAMTTINSHFTKLSDNMQALGSKDTFYSMTSQISDFKEQFATLGPMMKQAEKLGVAIPGGEALISGAKGLASQLDAFVVAQANEADAVFRPCYCYWTTK